jgi:hypothetical protein
MREPYRQMLVTCVSLVEKKNDEMERLSHKLEASRKGSDKVSKT